MEEINDIHELRAKIRLFKFNSRMTYDELAVRAVSYYSIGSQRKYYEWLNKLMQEKITSDPGYFKTRAILQVIKDWEREQ